MKKINAGAELAKIRWKKTTQEERSAHARMMVMCRLKGKTKKQLSEEMKRIRRGLSPTAKEGE
jgi:hypothetical protein